MRKSSKRRASGAASFLISCLAAIFAFCAAMLVARNIGSITDGSALLGYSANSGILNFFGEPIELPKNAVNALLSYPAASARFTLGLFPETVQTLLSGVGTMLWDSFCSLGGFLANAFVDFLKLGM